MAESEKAWVFKFYIIVVNRLLLKKPCSRLGLSTFKYSFKTLWQKVQDWRSHVVLETICGGSSCRLSFHWERGDKDHSHGMASVLECGGGRQEHLQTDWLHVALQRRRIEADSGQDQPRESRRAQLVHQQNASGWHREAQGAAWKFRGTCLMYSASIREA